MDVTITSDTERTWSKFKVTKYDHPYRESRVFVDFGENVWEHLQNRRSRPYTTLKPLVAAALSERSIPFTKLSWNRYAGCGMCPCSGGFIIEGGQTGHDLWVTVS